MESMQVEVRKRVLKLNIMSEKTSEQLAYLMTPDQWHPVEGASQRAVHW